MHSLQVHVLLFKVVILSGIRYTLKTASMHAWEHDGAHYTRDCMSVVKKKESAYIFHSKTHFVKCSLLDIYTSYSQSAVRGYSLSIEQNTSFFREGRSSKSVTDSRTDYVKFINYTYMYLNIFSLKTRVCSNIF